MKKAILLIASIGLLQSCIVSTATKAVTGVAKLGYKTVKGTVNAASWAVSKAAGKIDEDRVDGTWKVVGVYKGSFAQFQQDQNRDSSFESECGDAYDQIIFKSNKSTGN